MTILKRLGVSISFIVIAIGLTACPDRVSIADIEANPSKFQNKEIGIIGTVKDSYGLAIPGTPIRGGVYKIDDGTGSIWVVSESNVPAKGTRIGVKGKVGNGVTWGSRNYGLGIYETGRRVAKR